MMQANRLYAKTKVGPASAARLESRFQVAWMKAARTTRESESSDMRPPCHLARSRSRHLLLWAFVPRVQPRATAVSATLGPAMAVSPSGTLVATQSMELRYVRESGAVNPEFMLQVRNAARIKLPDPATAATSRESAPCGPSR